MIENWREITRRNWTWNLKDPTVLEPWFEHYEQLELTPVKQNVNRTVFFVKDVGGNRYYVKHFHPRDLWGRFRRIFRSKAAYEFKVFEQLLRSGVPTAEPMAFGVCYPEGMLVTRSLDHYVTSSQFWFSGGWADRVKRKLFLEKVARLLGEMNRRGITHTDFHSGNLMVEPQSLDLALIDLYEVGFGPAGSTLANRLALMNLFGDFAADLTDDEIVAICAVCQIGQGANGALRLWKKFLAHRAALRDREWPRRRAQILSGTSKFCRKTELRGSMVYLRNSRWFEPQEIRVAELAAHRMSADAAQQLWLESFRRELRGESNADDPTVPLAWEIGPEISTLYFRIKQ